jgi:hypothetical protein
MQNLPVRYYRQVLYFCRLKPARSESNGLIPENDRIDTPKGYSPHLMRGGFVKCGVLFMQKSAEGLLTSRRSVFNVIF